MNYKDLQERCTVKLEDKEKSNVFYFRPETFLLEDPEKQRLYREDLLKKISGMPKPEPFTFLGDDIHRAFCQTVADRSTAQRTKQTLHQYFLRRQYNLQHLKYKLLVRWAHQALNSEVTEQIGQDAAFMFGKIEFNLEQAIKRCERLEKDDFFDTAKANNRPGTKASVGHGSLYVENSDLAPQSLIREDDVEVYIRGVSYRNKVNKLVNKFMSRLKWMPLERRFEIFTLAVNKNQEIKEDNIKKQRKFAESRSKMARDYNKMSVNQEKELLAIEDLTYINVYDKMFINNIEKIKYSWKSNHDTVPELVADQYGLKLQIKERATKFELSGDVEIDHGYPFVYQVSTFFPSYFQKQVIKAQFSIYDLFAHEVDVNIVQKRTLGSMTRVDTNIFRDISSIKGSVPSDESLAQELKSADIKVIRLKSAVYWIDYIILSPNEPDWHKRQQAVLKNENQMDELLKAGMNFLDVNDLATVNRVNEESAILHQKNVNKILNQNPHDQVKDFKITTTDGEKSIKVDTIRNKNCTNEAFNIEKNLLKCVEDSQDENQVVASNFQGIVKGSLRYCAQHLLTTLYTLRFIQSRDNKTRISYALNYFRSIQKRFAIDLREFGTRERMDSHIQDPFIRSKDASQQIISSSQRSVGVWIKGQQKENQEFSEPHRNLTVFDEAKIAKMNNMATLRGYKLNGIFNTKIFSTCPGFPKFHDTFGEPLQEQPVCDEQGANDKNNKNISSQAIKFMGRIDHIELNEQLMEVYVKDDFGVYIFYDCVFQDMKSLEGEILKIANYYLQRSEVLLDPTQSSTGNTLPVKDRLQILDDILSLEAEFNFKKVKLMQVYVECYDHVCDPVEQQRLMQIITDIGAQRPRLNLGANYFKDSYLAELKCLDAQFELVRILVDSQISLEKTENTMLQDQINLSFQIANLYEKNQWKYEDSNVLLEALIKSKKEQQEKRQRKEKIEKQIQKDKEEMAAKLERKKTKQAEKEMSENNDTSEFNEDEYFKPEENQFTQLLGLPQISLETIYAGFRENDNAVLEIMNENANFIVAYEGYPEYLTHLKKKSIRNNILFQPNSWSQQTGALDFYDSLDFVVKLYSIQQNITQELFQALKPHDGQMMTCIETCVAELSLQEYRKTIQILQGSVEEYQGRDYVENEQIMGSSDKQIFYAKEMISDLTFTPKAQLNPFIIAKTDIKTISFFDFPIIFPQNNKYVMRKKGISGYQYQLECEKSALTGIGKSKAKKSLGLASDVKKASDNIGIRNVNVPVMLEVYCNLIELHRLRNEIILTVSETQVLREVYKHQQEIANCKNIKIELPDGISFKQIEMTEGEIKLVNFVDDGPSHQITIGLAIREFDPMLLSNFNFLSPDTFKINILTSGLEEVRAILQYQLYFKYLLIVATRTNQAVIDNHERALAELSLLNQTRTVISLPNPMFNIGDVCTRSLDCIELSKVKELQQFFKSNLASVFQPMFYNVSIKKSQQRTAMALEFNQYQTAVCAQYPATPYCVARIMRTFKLKLLTKFIQQLMTDVCLDAQKIQILNSCNRLRVYNRYFNFNPNDVGIQCDDPAVFKLETSNLVENVPFNYQIQKSDTEIERKALSTSDLEILDFATLPSSLTVIQCNSTDQEDLNLFKIRKSKLQEKYQIDQKSDLKQFPSEINISEKHLKALLPTFTPKNEDLSDFEEALNFGDCKIAKLVRHYQGIERVIALEWFINKTQLKSSDTVILDNSIECGLPFWKLDEFDSRARHQTELQQNQKNQRAQQFLYHDIASLQNRKHLAQEIVSMSLIMKSLISEIKKTKPNHRQEYLNKYTDFRYLQIVMSFNKLTQQFYYQNNIPAVISLNTAIANLTKMDHVRVKCMGRGNYNVQTALVDQKLQLIDSCNLIYGCVQIDQIQNFKKFIQPILNERALEPPQITLFQSIYQNDPSRTTSNLQFVGQFDSPQFQDLGTALLELNHQDRQYCQSFLVQAKYQANDFMDSVYGDDSMQNVTNEDVYNMSQLKDAVEFMYNNLKALLLRNAVICWKENQPLPNSAEKYMQFEKSFRQNYFWKILEIKKEVLEKWSNQHGNHVPTQKEIEELKIRIDTLQQDQTLATKTAEDKRDAMVKALQEEFRAMKKKVNLDQWFTTKAEVELFSNEIEMSLIQASISALDSECAALSKCFTIAVPTIQMHIHPFQQFAATFFDTVDPSLHLDVCNKLSAVQILLTRLKNRGTQVETLTSGPGMVFTIKDLNECLLDFSRQIVTYGERELKSRSCLNHSRTQHYHDNLYIKDQKISWLEHRIKQIGINIENIVDARLFEKGNQLIYQLDQANRLISLFKRNLGDLESRIYEKVQGEQAHKFKRQMNQLEHRVTQFKNYKDYLKKDLGDEFVFELDRIKEILNTKVLEAISKDPDYKWVGPVMYPISAPQKEIKKTKKVEIQVTTGAVIPKGFQHYSNCTCYVPNPNHPAPTLEMAELEMLSEQQARFELVKMSVLLRKQRLLWRTKEMCQQQKYQDKINILMKQQSNNTYLWEQLAESQKRERVLQQELVFTQQSLAASEKVIEKLKEEIRSVEADRCRLENYKISKQHRLNELEEQVKKIELFDHVDTDKLLMALTKKDKDIKALQAAQIAFDAKIQLCEIRREKDVQLFRKSIQDEQKRTHQVIEKMDQMKLELKMLESSDSNVATIWKKKCMDIFEVTKVLKQENDDLRLRCKELIENGIQLAQAIGDYNNKSKAYETDLTRVKMESRPVASTAGTLSQDTPTRQHFKPFEYENSVLQSPNSPMDQTFKPHVPQTAQNQQRNRYVAAGAAVVSRHKNDLKAILNGTSHQYDNSIQSKDFKQTKHLGSVITQEATKMSKAKRLVANQQDSIFHSTSKTQSLQQAEASFFNARTWVKPDQLDLRGQQLVSPRSVNKRIVISNVFEKKNESGMRATVKEEEESFNI